MKHLLYRAYQDCLFRMVKKREIPAESNQVDGVLNVLIFCLRQKGSTLTSTMGIKTPNNKYWHCFSQLQEGPVVSHWVWSLSISVNNRNFFSEYMWISQEAKKCWCQKSSPQKESKPQGIFKKKNHSGIHNSDLLCLPFIIVAGSWFWIEFLFAVKYI